MIVVIGAGPAGLATAYYLKQLRARFVILERAEVGASWRRHYRHLRLHSLKSMSHLPGLTMPKHYPRFPSGSQFYDYLQQYAQHFHLPVQTGVAVRRVHYDATWHITTNCGTWQADTLIVATGIYSTPHRPTLPGERAFSGTILHAQQYDCPEPLAGRHVLVVGCGNSGAEIAAALAAHRSIGTVGIAVRSGVAFVPCPRAAVLGRAAAWLFRTLPQPVSDVFLGQIQRGFPALGLPLPPTPPSQRTPVVGYTLVKAIRAGRVRVHPAISHLHGETVIFEDNECVHYDTIILATGYRPTLTFLDPTPTLNNSGRLERPHPALHLVGFEYPTTEPFLYAIGRKAQQTAHAATQSAARTPNPPTPLC
jgi:cation diffusion facilitator CzcD-associated flavoprotein CzcO